jgi:hypothetical protein
MRLGNGLKLRIEPFEWRAGDAEAELAPPDVPERELAAALRRYALPTGVADAPAPRIRAYRCVKDWQRAGNARFWWCRRSVRAPSPGGS